MICHVSSSVSVFAYPWKHRCRNTICFPRSRNVSYQIQKHFMFPNAEILFMFVHLGKHGGTLAGLPRAVDLVHLKCILSSCILVHLKLLSRLRSEFSDLVMGKHSKHSKESNEKRCVLFSCQSCFILFIHTRYPANQTLTRLYIYIRIKCFFFF